MKAFATLALALLSAAAAFAQTASGSMAGAIVDSTGAVLPGATVTAINELNGQTRTSTSDEDGNFVFQALAPGAYTVRVELEGFQTLERKGNMLIASGRLALGDLALDVGQQTESVTVTARGERVATTTTSHQAILDLQQVTNLSIRGRDPVSLLKILPGVSLLANDQETFGGSFSTPVPNIQGGRGQTLYVDGINGGDGGGGGNFSGATNLDAIAEVNVQMSAYTAEHGLKGGAQVNFITKHGGSEYRGTAYTYQRHEMFNATNFFNNKDEVEKPEYRYSTIGGNLGGPAPKIPGLNPQGNKLFFFYSLDDTQLKDPQQLRRFTMPTARERAGDFSQTRTTSGDLIVVRDPLTGQPFPGNIIPADRADPRGVAMLNLFPLPNTDGSGYNYLTQEDSIDHPRRQHLIRVDYRATDQDSFAVKYQTWYTKSVGWNVAGASARWGLVRQRYDFTADQGKIDYTRTFGANTVLELGTGIFYSTEDGPPEDNVALAGIQRSTYPELAALPQFAPIHNPLNLIPRVVFGDLQNNSRDEGEITYDGRWPIYGADTALSTALNLTHTRGAHTFKLGIMHEYERFGQARSGTFGGEFNFEYDGADPGNAGFGYANAFIGHVTEYSESMGRVGDNRRQNTLAWFVQDTWKVNSQLTLDLGVRMYKWDHPHQGGGEASVFSLERFDPEWGGNPPVLFEPTTTGDGRRALNPMTGEVVPETFIGQILPGTGYTCGVITPSTPCEINGVVVQQDGSYVEGGRGFIDPIGVLFDPRVGMAYAINPKTVVRAAGGVFHNATGGPTFDGGPAFNFTRTIRYTDMRSYLTGTGTTTPTDVSGIERTNAKQPVTYRYTLGLQREIGWNTVLDVAYVGDTTHNLGLDWNYNAIPAGARFLPEHRDDTVDASAANPGALPDEFLRPITGFGDIAISSPIGKSWYDSLQLQVTRRFTGGFELAGSYTWAKGFATGLYQDNPLPSSAAKTRSNIQEHVVVASYMVDVPAGSRLVRWDPAKWVLDDWRVSGISTFATGGFANIEADFSDDFDFSGGGETCGNIIMTGDLNLPAGERTVDRWFDTSVFQRPTGRGDIGNNCYNAKIRLPGFHNHDISLFKDFPLKGNHRLQFRWEIYNLFNHSQWNEVETEAQFDADGRQTNSDFGTVTSARNERRMQFSLRYSF
ncbi:MAG: carboxypeptidase regulatory-like domain-containing protein [Vicinamibacteraceae bacterium]